VNAAFDWVNVTLLVNDVLTKLSMLEKSDLIEARRAHDSPCGCVNIAFDCVNAALSIDNVSSKLSIVYFLLVVLVACIS